MITIKSVFDDVRFLIGKENGYISISDFNRLSKMAEDRLLDWITGRVEGNILPIMYINQKDKDYVSPFITPYKTSLVDGKITKPADYYTYENLFALIVEDIICDEDDVECGSNDDVAEITKVPVKLLDGDQFVSRLTSRIDGLRPTDKKPIAKEVGNYFEFAPNALAGVVLEYIRYPKYGVAVGMIDQIYNEEVINEGASTDYEWGEYAHKFLVQIIVDLFINSVRDTAMKSFNDTTSKLNP